MIEFGVYVGWAIDGGDQSRTPLLFPCCHHPARMDSYRVDTTQSSPIHQSFPEYLCGPEANLFNIDFTRFTIRDMETGMTLFEIAKPPPQGEFSPVRIRVLQS